MLHSAKGSKNVYNLSFKQYCTRKILTHTFILSILSKWMSPFLRVLVAFSYMCKFSPSSKLVWRETEGEKLGHIDNNAIRELQFYLTMCECKELLFESAFFMTREWSIQAFQGAKGEATRKRILSTLTPFKGLHIEILKLVLQILMYSSLLQEALSHMHIF